MSAPLLHAPQVSTMGSKSQTSVVGPAEVSQAADPQVAVLERRVADLQQDCLELEHFLRAATHDLEEPLRMISSFGELLVHEHGEQLEGSAREYLGYVCDGAARMQTLLRDLVSYSRLTTKAGSHAWVSLAEIIEDVEIDLASTLEREGGRIDMVGDLPRVYVVRSLVHQVVQQLVSNAIRFRRRDVPPQVRVSAVATGHGLRIEFADNGEGLDPRHSERVFEPFVRLHPRGRYRGSGLGLAICRRAIEHHGGRITLRSTPGHGTVVVFSLPDTGPQPDGDQHS
ncbi:MAG: hypothetical protein K0V04_28295 [Deltaproteobacteria bacterium]|nr:hypothetical protein [Deltaproteobacteria bacterium]